MLTNIEIEVALELKAGVKIEKARQIAALSEGNFREAQHLLQHEDDDWQVVLREWLNMIVKRNTSGQVKWVEEMSRNGREKQKQFLKYFTHLLETAIRIEVMATRDRGRQNVKVTEAIFTFVAIDEHTHRPRPLPLT